MTMPRSSNIPATLISITLIQVAYVIGVLGVICLITQLAGCTPYRKEISRSGLLSDLKDKQQGSQKRIDPEKIHPVFGVPGGKIRQEDPDGKVILYSKTIKHLMNHLIHALEYEERDLFVEQILSQITIDEFKDRGLDPAIAFDELLVRKRDIYRLFHFMPMGERTPGLYPTPVGTNIFRLQISRIGREDLLWIGMDVSFEQGNYKLRWFID